LVITSQTEPLGLGLPLDGYAEQRRLTDEGLGTLRERLRAISTWATCGEPRLLKVPGAPDADGSAEVHLDGRLLHLAWDSGDHDHAMASATEQADVRTLNALLADPLGIVEESAWELSAEPYLPTRWQVEFAVAEVLGPVGSPAPVAPEPADVILPGGDRLAALGVEVPDGLGPAWITRGHRCTVVSHQDARAIRVALDDVYDGRWSWYDVPALVDGQSGTAVVLIRGLRPHEEDCYGAMD
jgi:hypothetical protein